MIDVRTRAFSPGPESAGIVRAAAGIRTYLEAARVSRPFVDIDQGSWNLAAGVLLQLQKAGITYAVDDDWLPMFTEAARATGGERLVLSVSGAARHVVLRSRPGVQTVIESDPVYVDAYGFITNK